MNILITGSNRGIGLEFVRQYLQKGAIVYASCRAPESATELVQLSAKFEKNLHIEQLDVCDDLSVQGLAEKLSNVSIDLLINNAGTAGESGVTIGNIDRSNFLDVMNINCLSVLKICEAFLPHVEKSAEKLVTVISSRMGSITDNTSGRSYAYRASKAALNAAMRSFAVDTEARGIKVLLMHPGWVRTRMGGDDGTVTVEESVSAMLNQFTKIGPTAHGEAVYRYDTGEKVPL